MPTRAPGRGPASRCASWFSCTVHPYRLSAARRSARPPLPVRRNLNSGPLRRREGRRPRTIEAGATPGERAMLGAYILIQAEIGAAASIAVQVAAVPGVVAAVGVTGPYDIIARAEAENAEDMGNQVVARIQRIEGITAEERAEPGGLHDGGKQEGRAAGAEHHRPVPAAHRQRLRELGADQ